MKPEFASIPHIYRDYRDLLAPTAPDLSESEWFFARDFGEVDRNLMVGVEDSRGRLPMWQFAVLTRYGIYVEGRFVGRMRETPSGTDTTLGVVCRWDGVGIALGYWGYSRESEKRAALPHILALLGEPVASHDALTALRSPRWARNDFNPWTPEVNPNAGSHPDNQWLPGHTQRWKDGELRFTSLTSWPGHQQSSFPRSFFMHPNKSHRIQPQYFEDLLPLPEPLDIGAFGVALDHALTDDRYSDVLRDMPFLYRLLEDKKISPSAWYLRSTYWATKMFERGMARKTGLDPKNWVPWLVPSAFVSCPHLPARHNTSSLLPTEVSIQDSRYQQTVFLMQARMIDSGRSGVLHWLLAADQNALDRKMLPLISQGPTDRMSWACPRYRVRLSMLPIGDGIPYMPLTDVPAPEYSTPPGDDDASHHP